MKVPELLELKNELIELSEIITAAALKSNKPVADEMSTRQAHAEYGKEWIRYHTSRGHIKPIRKGPFKNSKKVFSRLELVALKEAERRVVVKVKEQL